MMYLLGVTKTLRWVVGTGWRFAGGRFDTIIGPRSDATATGGGRASLDEADRHDHDSAKSAIMSGCLTPTAAFAGRRRTQSMSESAEVATSLFPPRGSPES